MSCSKPLQPFVCDSLYYLSRNQLERFSIACRPLKNFIERYLRTKPYRIFDRLWIRGGSYALFHNDVQWHPNRDDYSVHQFLANQKCSIEQAYEDPAYYSFADMLPYLGATVHIKMMTIAVTGDSTYNSEHIEQMESIAYLWRDSYIFVRPGDRPIDFVNIRLGADDLNLVLNSPIILQCRELILANAHFSFKDYKVLCAVKVIRIFHYVDEEIDLWHQYWEQFLEQPGAKPVVAFRSRFNTIIDRLSKAFSSAVSPNAYTIVFFQDDEPLTEFRKMNYTSGEKLELKKGYPVEYKNELSDIGINYTLARSNI